MRTTEPRSDYREFGYEYSYEYQDADPEYRGLEIAETGRIIKKACRIDFRNAAKTPHANNAQTDKRTEI